MNRLYALLPSSGSLPAAPTWKAMASAPKAPDRHFRQRIVAHLLRRMMSLPFISTPALRSRFQPR